MKHSMKDFWNKQAEWSQETFGKDSERGPIGPAKHLLKEVRDEVLPMLENGTFADPTSQEARLEEFADLLFLVFDSTRRAGFSYKELLKAAHKKLEKNKKRTWNKPIDNEPVEHTRNEE